MPALAAVLLFAAPAAAQSPSPSPSPAPTTAAQGREAAARAEFAAWQAGKVDWSRYAAAMKVPDATVTAVSAQLRPVGAPTTVRPVSSQPFGAGVTSIYRVETAAGPPITEQITWDGAGKITGLSFRPASP